MNMAEQFVNHTWVCSRCRVSFVERFHLKTDGDPRTADPPTNWVRVQEAKIPYLLCPACAARREEVTQRAMSLSAENSKTYADLTEEQATDRWKSSHICLGCFHLEVCRFAQAARPQLVAVSSCRAFKTRMDFEDA